MQRNSFPIIGQSCSRFWKQASALLHIFVFSEKAVCLSKAVNFVQARLHIFVLSAEEISVSRGDIKAVDFVQDQLQNLKPAGKWKVLSAGLYFELLGFACTYIHIFATVHMICICICVFCICMCNSTFCAILAVLLDFTSVSDQVTKLLTLFVFESVFDFGLVLSSVCICIYTLISIKL